MASINIAHFMDLRNLCLDSLDDLHNLVYEAQALVEVAISHDFTEWPQYVARYYMVALCSSIEAIERKNGQILEKINQFSPLS